jgi:hypothetical protein
VDTSSNLGIHEQSLAIAYHILMSSSKVQIGIEVSMESRSVGFVHVPLIGCVNDADCSWSHEEMESVTCQEGIVMSIDQYVQRLQICMHKWNRWLEVQVSESVGYSEGKVVPLLPV